MSRSHRLAAIGPVVALAIALTGCGLFSTPSATEIVDQAQEI